MSIYSCDLFPEAKAEPKYRASLSSFNTSMTLRAWIESTEGMSLNGGMVYAVDPSSEVIYLDYDSTRSSYVGQKSSPQSGDYQIVFQSAVAQTKVQKVTFQPILGSPELVSITDSSGNSAFLGQTLNTGDDILIVWKPLLGASIYSIKVLDGLKVVFGGNSIESFFTIPHDSLLSSGQVVLQISGQSIQGDPLYQKANYYTIAVSDTTNFYFKVLKI